ncbi:glycosyltransferase family 2 protein [Tepidanaerobacter acetatoxydans]|uniref:glycosyltransferase family 2 protein n=1 Tax=Tepidanaerobacter acetatoxydans TaxID=499229 RepID=UPI001BD5BBD0|nr:glycosyltransferase family 2 protein [Tepidanaerobacter acetatoxydans]
MGKHRESNIVAMMPARNESGRHLCEVLNHLSQWVDKIVVLDDASEDDTFEIVNRNEKVIAYKNEHCIFEENESALRSKLWELTIAQNPNWILAIDADEIFEDRIIDEILLLINQDYYDAIYFRVFDFWSSKICYRIDGGWNPWTTFWPFLIRYNPDISYYWPDREIHCGRFPRPCENFIPYYSDIRIKHFGWADSKDHYKKFLFYRDKDIKFFGQIRPHTQSIMITPKPHDLETWKDSKRLSFLQEVYS